MAFRLEYVPRRVEIWRWYWQSWRRSLWKRHLGLFLFITILTCTLGRHQLSIGASTATAVTCCLIVVAVLVLYPQVMFKPQTRSLLMDASGLETAIGTLQVKRAWADIRTIVDDGGYVIITGTNGNPFIVPPRAFPSPAVRASFLLFARRSVQGGHRAVD
jgi:hypothetical protein